MIVYLCWVLKQRARRSPHSPRANPSPVSCTFLTLPSACGAQFKLEGFPFRSFHSTTGNGRVGAYATTHYHTTIAADSRIRALRATSPDQRSPRATGGKSNLRKHKRKRKTCGAGQSAISLGHGRTNRISGSTSAQACAWACPGRRSLQATGGTSRISRGARRVALELAPLGPAVRVLLRRRVPAPP